MLSDERTLRVLAHEYDDAPAIPKSTQHRRILRSYWDDYGNFLRERAAYISSRITVKECRYEAYEDGAGIRADVASKRIVVTRDFSPHPFFDLETNQAMRLVHDIDGHAASGLGFTWQEEVGALRAQVRRTPIRFLPALFTQTLHQLASTTHNKRFPDEQKVLVTSHGEFRALLFGTGRALPSVPSIPTHEICEDCDLDHPHSHVKGEA